MTTTVTATFENGVLRPDETLPLEDRARVTLTIVPIKTTPAESPPKGWAAVKAWIRQNPLHGLGPRLTRDELHERR